MDELQEKIANIPVGVVVYDDFASKVAAYKAGHHDARRAAADLVAEDEASRPDAAVAAIQFALKTDEASRSCSVGMRQTSAPSGVSGPRPRRKCSLALTRCTRVVETGR